MSWSDRRQVLVRLGSVSLLGAVLGGCFRPMLAKDSPSAALIGRIRLPDFDDRFGYYLNDSLRDRLGRPQAEDFRLEVKTRIARDDLAITQDSAVTRISVTTTADWALYRAGSGGPPAKRPQPPRRSEEHGVSRSPPYGSDFDRVSVSFAITRIRRRSTTRCTQRFADVCTTA